MNNYYRACTWLFAVSFIGLYQVLAIILDRFTDHKVIEIKSLICDGHFLFFSLTLLSIFLTDQIVSAKKGINNKGTKQKREIKLKQTHFEGFIVYPFILIILSLLVYHTSKSKTLEKDIIDVLCCIHYAIYTFTFIIALTYKVEQINNKIL